MRTKQMFVWAAVLAGLLGGPGAWAAPTVDPEADRIFKACSQYLAEAKSFSMKVEVWKDFVSPSGTKVQVGRTLEVQHQRPDRLHVHMRGPWANHEFWYEGKSLTMLDRGMKLYGVMEAGKNLDETIDLVEDKFGVEIPLGDVLVADPYQNVAGNIERGLYMGKTTVLGVTCHHLVFNGVNADVQVWVADGAKPLPRKIVINFKAETGSPTVTQIFTDWDLVSPISPAVFQFVEPSGANKINVNPKQ